MNQLHNWSIKRSAATMTITHSTGKITGITSVQRRDGQIVATDGEYEWVLV